MLSQGYLRNLFTFKVNIVRVYNGWTIVEHISETIQSI